MHGSMIKYIRITVPVHLRYINGTLINIVGTLSLITNYLIYNFVLIYSQNIFEHI